MSRTRAVSFDKTEPFLNEHERRDATSIRDVDDNDAEKGTYSPPIQVLTLPSTPRAFHFFPRKDMPASQYYCNEEVQSIRVQQPVVTNIHTIAVAPVAELQMTTLSITPPPLSIDPIESQEAKNQATIVIDNSQAQPTSILTNFVADNKLGVKIWPVVFLGLLAHDLYYFTAKPQDRYGNTLANIFLGLPVSQWNNFMSEKVRANENTWLNHLGDDNPTNYFFYWAGTGAVIVVPPLIRLAQAVIRKIGHYNLDTITAEDSNKIWRSLTYFSRVVSVYAYLYFAVLCAQKIIDTVHYWENKNDCETKDKVYSEISMLADYLCTVCGDWEDLNLSLTAMNTSQGCLSGLMAEKRSPQNILDRMNRFVKLADFTRLDLSLQQYSIWDDDQFQELLNTVALAKHNSSLDILNLSGNEFDTITLSVKKISAITDFIKKIAVNNILFRNQIISPALLNDFFNGFKNTTVNAIDLSGTIIGDAGAKIFGEVLPYTGIKTAIMNHNGISDLQSPSLLEGVSYAGVTTLSLDDNELTDKSLVAMENNTKLEVLGLASMPAFTADGLEQWGSSFNQSSITSLVLSHNNFGDDEIAALCPYFQQSGLEKIDFSYNNLNSEFSATTFFSNLPSHSLGSLDVSYTQLNAAGALSNFMNNSVLTELIFKGNKLEMTEWASFFQMIVNSNVEYLDLEDSEIDDDIFHLLANELKKSSSNLKRVNLRNNKMTDVGGIELLHTFSQIGVEEVNLANNLFTAVFAKECASQLRAGSNFTVLDLSGQMESSSITKIFAAIPGSGVMRFVANDIVIDDQDAVTLVENLVTSSVTDDLSFLGHDSLSKNQKRVSLNANTNLTHLSFDGLSEKGQFILNRALMLTSITNDSMWLENMPAPLFISANQSASAYSPHSLGFRMSENHAENSRAFNGSAVALIASIFLLSYLIKLIIKSSSSLQKSSIFTRSSQNMTEINHREVNKNHFVSLTK